MIKNVISNSPWKESRVFTRAERGRRLSAHGESDFIHSFNKYLVNIDESKEGS
jgi:hypothetical protein